MRISAMGVRPVFIALVCLCVDAYYLGSVQPAAPAAPVNAPGRVEGATDVTAIGTAATGVIAELLAHNGEHVRAGQLLVRIRCDVLQKELEGRRSNLGAAEAVFARAVHGNRAEEIDIGIANVGFAEARSEEAAIALRRALSLSEGVTITKAQVDQVKRDARITAAQLDEARARLALLRAGTRQEDILQAQHTRDAAKALVDESAERLNDCSVRAPTDGIVLQTLVAPGQFVSSAIPVALLRFVDDTKRRVRAEVDERDLSKICVPQRAIIRVDGIPGVELAAVSESMSAMMRPRSLYTDDHPTSGGGDVREVMLALSEDASVLPIGLRVMVGFASCAAAQVAPAK